MNIVTIGSDKSLVGGPALGDAVQRHALYGTYVDHIDIIVYTQRREGLHTLFPISANVFGHPTNSVNKFSFALDAVRIFSELQQVRKTDVIVCQDPFLFALVGIYLKRRWGCKLQVNFHGDFWHNPKWRRESWLHPFLELLSRFTVRQADAIRVVSEGIADTLREAGIKPGLIHTIPTPVQKPEARGQIRFFTEGANYLVADLRLVVTKNIYFMLDVFRSFLIQCPGYKLWIIGDGPLRAQIETYIQQQGLSESVYCLGLLPHHELGLYFRQARAQLLFSKHESFGKVIVEAGLWGCPTIASDTVGARSIIKHEYTGLLVPVDDFSASLNALVRLMNDESLRDTLGHQAAEDYAQRFATSSTVEKIINVWRSLVA